MDVLVVVGPDPAPERLVAKATTVVHLADPGRTSEIVAELRARLPRDVGVVAAGTPGLAAPGAPAAPGGAPASAPDPGLETAAHLHRAGFPVTLYTDAPPAAATGHGAGSAGIRVLPLSDPGPSMNVGNSLLDLVGHTPIVRLDRVGRDLACHLLAKLEFMNPGGSVKDRPAVAMIEAAEREGRLAKGGTIVEPTSGNTGVGLAIVAARKRYRCVFVMPDKVAPEKVSLLRAYGAEVIVCPTTVAPDHPDSYYSVSNRLAAEIPGAYKPDQYANPANPACHEHTTGPEIWDQTAGRITHFVAGIGTGGTISGVGRYLKAQNPAVRVVGADPEGSVYSGGSGRPYLVEGIGEDFWPTTYDPAVVDEVVKVSDRDSFATARRVTREEGILVGGSTGTAVKAALEVGRPLGPEHVVVVLIPDSGRGYLSKLYNDAWMADFGFLRTSGQTVADVVAAKSPDIPPLVHVHPDDTVQEVISILREFGVSQVPVLKAEPPLVVAEVVGAVQERELLDAAFRDPAVLGRSVGEVMGPALPTVGIGEPVDVAVTRVGPAGAVLVLDAGHPVGIVTRTDLLAVLAGPGPGPGAGIGTV